jgi:S1-C subfamily serine protease
MFRHHVPVRIVPWLAALTLAGSALAGCGATRPSATALSTPVATTALTTSASASPSTSGTSNPTIAPVSPTAVATTAPTAAATSSATAASPAVAAGSVQAAPVDPLPVLPATSTGAGTIADVAAKARPAVVQITNQQLTRQAFQGQPILAPAGVGSGVIYDTQGHILTNNHVVAGAQNLQVSLPDGRSFPAKLIGGDPRSDLAVVQIQGNNLPTLPLGDSSKLVVGQWVIAIGNALALEGGPTVTAGIVSALGRAVQEPASSGPGGGPNGGASGSVGGFLVDAIQTDAPINPGNSGGPLINLSGEVVGINTLAAVQAEPGVPAQNIGFAIAINTAKQIADQLVATGHVTYPYIGVSLAPNSPAIAARFGFPNKPGMIVYQVDPSGPAAKVGVQPNDVITAVDGQSIQDESTLYKILLQKKPGDKMNLTLARGDQTVNVTVTLGTAPQAG